jgi:hypothetical protein
MKGVSLIVVACVLVGACSDDVKGSGSPCSDISGNWQVTSQRLDGNCPASLDGDGKSTATFSKRADGGWQTVFPGVEGGCPGNLDAATCKFTATCELEREAKTIATISIEYTFAAGNTFSGTTVNAAGPPIADPACNATYRDTATKL